MSLGCKGDTEESLKEAVLKEGQVEAHSEGQTIENGIP